MYKLFTQITTTRLEKKLEINLENQQDLGASTLRQITLKEKCREYNIPMSVAFVD